MSIRNTSQLKALIKNQAKEKQTSPGWLLTYYMMERFLKRISLSHYRDRMVLKGGLLISILLDLSERSSGDLDLSFLKSDLSYAFVQDILQEIMEIDADDSIQFILEDIAPIQIHKDRLCYRAKVLAEFEKIRVPFSIDITSGDVITPKAIPCSLKPLFETQTITILGYPIESILSEKIEAILSDQAKGRRIRDYYDLYALSLLQPKYVGKTLLKAICSTFKNRHSLTLLENLPEFIERIKSSKDLERIWAGYQRKNPCAKEIRFDLCIQALENVLKEVLPGKFL